MSCKEHAYYLRKAVEVSKRARENGNTPFGAILVDEQGNILIEQENIERSHNDCTGHAEAALMRTATKMYSRAFLAKCRLYTSVEPCAMCAGAIFWGNVKKVIYGMSERNLLKLAGDGPMLDLPCRDVFSRTGTDIEVIGPFAELEDEVAEVHEGFWKLDESI